MRTLLTLPLFLLLVAAAAPATKPAEKEKPAPQPARQYGKDDVYDAPAKVQVVRKYVATGRLTSAGVEALLRKGYAEVIAKGGFRNAPHPTHVQILVYLNDADAKDQADQIGLLHKMGDEDVSVSVTLPKR